MGGETTQAIRATAILSVFLWIKVVATNVGLGGAKVNAGGRAPEDTYQTGGAAASEDAKVAQARAQRIVNNDLENVPYTLVLAWGAVYCIAAADAADSAQAHIFLFTVFTACRFAHTIVYSKGLSKPRSLVWFLGVLCSFGIAFNGAIASFQIP